MSGAPVAAGRFPVLDGLRAVGSLAVLTTHVGFNSGASLNGPVSGPLARLDIGVALFFVVSGFLLYRPRVAAALDGVRAESWGRYLRKRALRILPAYWAALVLAAVLVRRPEAPSGLDWVLHVLLLQVYDGRPQILGLGQMWSLSTEVAFYLVLPLLVMVLLPGTSPGPRTLRVTHALLASTIVLGQLWHMASTGGWHPEAGTWLPATLGWFAAGMLMAAWREATLRGRVNMPWVTAAAHLPGYCYAAAGLVFLVACTPVAGPYDLSPASAFEAGTKTLLYTVVAALLVLPASVVDGRGAQPARPALSTALLTSRPARWLGEVSYGLFCYHMAILFGVQQVLGHEMFTGGFWLLWVPTVAVSLLVSAASYRWLERPVMRWGAPRRQTPSPTTHSDSAATTNA